MFRCALLLIGIAAVACAGRGGGDTRHAAQGDLAAQLSGTRYAWVQAECNDSALDLASLGFERSLSIDAHPQGLLLTFESELATQGCFATSVWVAKPRTDGAWEIDPQAHVTLPASAACGAAEEKPMLGTLRTEGDQLALVTQHSPWCRGFDAHFVYRRTQPRQLIEREVVMRYVAHFDRRDAESVAGLFEAAGSLIEPFTRTTDGNYARHDGQEAVRAWYTSAFAATPWLALRVVVLDPQPEGRVVAEWEYMDARLGEPLRGRNLFLIVEGEIYETEVQLVSDPVPLRAQPLAKRPVTAPSTTP